MGLTRALAAIVSALLDARTRAEVDAAAGRALLVLTVAAVVALSLLLWTFPPRRRSRPAPIAPDVPSGPLVPAAELLAYAEWIRGTDHRHPDTVSWGQPYAWSMRYRGAHRTHRTGVVCDRTVELPVDELPAVVGEVSR